MKMEPLPQSSYDPRPGFRLARVPNFIAPSLEQIDFDHLAGRGVHHIVFDVDNTLVPFGQRHLDPERRTFLLRLKSHPAIDSLSLATNNPLSHKSMAASLGVRIIGPTPISFKPLPSFYHRLLRQVGSPSPAHIAMIGDKLVQDVWGANLLGLTTILVRPLGPDNPLDRLLRVRDREKYLLRHYLPKHTERWF